MRVRVRMTGYSVYVLPIGIGLLTNLASFVLGSFASPWLVRRWRSYHLRRLVDQRLGYYGRPSSRSWLAAQHGDVLVRSDGRSIPFITSAPLLVPIRDPDEAGLLDFEAVECQY